MFGDFLVNTNQNRLILKAICDNLTHATVGGISTLILIQESSHSIDEFERISLILLSFVISSFIDLDHFIVAKSFKLSVLIISNLSSSLFFLILFPKSNLFKYSWVNKIFSSIQCWLSWKFFSICFQRAVNLNERPFFHYSTIPIVIMLLMFILYQCYRSTIRWNLWLCIITCAFLTHHLRDATRRGFTMWPFGTTKPISYLFYIVGIMLAPFVLNKWLQFTTMTQHRYRSNVLIV